MCEGSEALASRLLKVNNMKREWPERHEGSEILTLV